MQYNFRQTRHPAEVRPRSGRLRVFDFDDTLVKTDSLVGVTKADGTKFKLSPGEYAVYIAEPDDIFDYNDFWDELKNPREIKWVASILKDVYSKYGPEGAVILTARANYKPIRKFLNDLGLQDVFVVALASADPQDKADYIERRIIEDDLEFVEFFDDSPANIKAVAELQNVYKYVTIVPRLLQHRAPHYK